MMSQLTIFSNPSFGQIRVMKDENQESLFCLKDLCATLLLDGKQIKRRLPKDTLSRHSLDTNGGIQSLSFVTESGLYDIILSSQHTRGEAADLVIESPKQGREWILWIEENVDFDQVFLERNAKGHYWVHVSCRRDLKKNRHQVLRLQNFVSLQTIKTN